MAKPIYVLGTGLSHDGSSCLLKDGKILVAIEKERITRVKHDGGNDYETVKYCLDAAGISIDDLSLVVQCANFEKDEIKKNHFKGNRFFSADCQVPFVTISHHLAHAYSAAGTCNFDSCNVMIIDGCGSFYHQCDDLIGATIPPHVNNVPGLFGEKDSYYHFDGQSLSPLFKDFSIINFLQQPNQVYLPTSNHSIGGLYAMASQYCFGDFDDVGKLMGLAPFGNNSFNSASLFDYKEGCIWVNEQTMHEYFTTPMEHIKFPFKTNFDYFANIARWVQDETEKAINYVFSERIKINPHENIAYAGGVALNAVANKKLTDSKLFKNIYIEPAAGDNGLAIGCAYYGWLQTLQREKISHNGSTFFGQVYHTDTILTALHEAGAQLNYTIADDIINATANLLNEGKTIGWFQLESEFGPRALGRRSILADPRIENIQHHINANIKFREDFRPFAPSVLAEDKTQYFENGYDSPYMLLVDDIKKEWSTNMAGIVHKDGSCRVQTVTEDNEKFYDLLKAWRNVSGISVLLNTSFNKKGMPIVETPSDAIAFFLTCALDVLIIDNYIIFKNND